MAKSLFTVGYEGRSLDAFIAELKSSAVNCLVDVREIPLSRKKGFSKTALSERLNEEGIGYVHLKELGSPKHLRNKLKTDWDYSSFFEKMSEYLADKTEAIEKLYAHVGSNTCCLMCFENLAATCHRKIVARKIKERDGNGLKIINL